MLDKIVELLERNNHLLETLIEQRQEPDHIEAEADDLTGPPEKNKPAVTLAQVQDAVITAIKRLGGNDAAKTKVRKALAKFHGAARASELEAGEYADAIAAIEKVK